MKNFYLIQKLSERWRSLQISTLTIVLLICFGFTTVHAQVSGYVFSQTSGSFTSISDVGTLVTGSEATATTTNDTTGWTVSIPFTFNFNSNDYTSVYVNSNGGVTFGTTTSTSSALISATTAYQGAIAVMNRDLWGAFVTSGVTTSGSDVITNVASFKGIEIGKLLNAVNGIPTGATVTAFDTAAGTITMSAPATSSSTAAVVRYGTGKIYTYTEGVAPNRTFIIEWLGYNDYNTVATGTNYLNFQLRLSETTNVISTVYGSQINISTTTRTNQIGLRGAANTDYNNRLASVTTPWTSTTQGTANTNTVDRNDVNFPPDGLTFIWTPPTCIAPGGITSTAQTTNSISLSWTAPTTPVSNGYTIYYTTTNTPPTSTTVLDTTNSATEMGTTTTISGLNPSTLYYFWIRSNCTSTDLSNWISGGSYATSCVPMTDMFENFDSYATGNIVPICWIRLAPATSPGSQTISTTTPYSGLRNIYMYASTTQTPVTVVLPEFSNINAGTHWLRLRARVTTATGNLKIGYVTNPSDASTFVLLQNLSLANTTYGLTSEYTVSVPTSIPANARLAIQNTADAKSYYFDDVYWEPQPTCFPPTGLAVTGQTTNSGSLSWTAASPTPTNGYTVYYSTTNTAPTSTTVLDTTNSATFTGTSGTISGLSPLTTYYVWIRSNCSSTDLSTWTQSSVNFATLCQPPSIISTTGQTVCPNTSATLSATADAGATITWYDSATGGNVIGTGNTYTTPSISNTTDYYVSAKTGSTGNVGPLNPSALGTISSSNFAIGTYYQIFDVTTPTTLISIDVFPVSTVAIGTASAIEIRDNTGATLTSVPYTVAVNDGVTPQTITLNYYLPVGTGYRIGQGIGINLNRNTAGAVYPFTSSAINVTGNNFTSGPAYWYYIYNWIFSSSCESSRTTVTATVDSACMGTTEVNAKDDLKVYPNPFKDVIYLPEIENVIDVAIFDLSGRLVKMINKPLRSLNLSDLNAGMYLLKVKYNEGETKSVKVLKK